MDHILARTQRDVVFHFDRRQQIAELRGELPPDAAIRAAAAANRCRVRPDSPAPARLPRASGSTFSSASRFSLRFVPLAVETAAVAADFSTHAPCDRAQVRRPAARNGTRGQVRESGQRDQNAARQQQRLRGLLKTCFWNSAPRLSSEPVRVTIKPPETEIISAGITVTRPSPMVRTV